MIPTREIYFITTSGSNLEFDNIDFEDLNFIPNCNDHTSRNTFQILTHTKNEAESLQSVEEVKTMC